MRMVANVVFTPAVAVSNSACLHRHSSLRRVGHTTRWRTTASAPATSWCGLLQYNIAFYAFCRLVHINVQLSISGLCKR